MNYESLPGNSIFYRFYRFLHNALNSQTEKKDVCAQTKTTKKNSEEFILKKSSSLTSNNLFHKKLFYDSFLLLSLALVALMFAGVYFQKIKDLDIFLKVPELIVLFPVILNLKGSIEINLTLRLSISVNNDFYIRWQKDIWTQNPIVQMLSLVIWL
jgi:hypothetical protein